MKELNFGNYNSTEWREFKRIYNDLFWDEVEQRAIGEAKRMLQEKVCKEFEMQIGARLYERTGRRRDERNGTRVRSYEISAGRIEELVPGSVQEAEKKGDNTKPKNPTLFVA